MSLQSFIFSLTSDFDFLMNEKSGDPEKSFSYKISSLRFSIFNSVFKDLEVSLQHDRSNFSSDFNFIMNEKSGEPENSFLLKSTSLKLSCISTSDNVFKDSEVSLQQDMYNFISNFQLCNE